MENKERHEKLYKEYFNNHEEFLENKDKMIALVESQREKIVEDEETVKELKDYGECGKHTIWMIAIIAGTSFVSSDLFSNRLLDYAGGIFAIVLCSLFGLLPRAVARKFDNPVLAKVTIAVFVVIGIVFIYFDKGILTSHWW